MSTTHPPITFWDLKCNLEKIFIMFKPGGASLNQRSEFSTHDKILIIMVTIIGRTTNTNIGTLNRRKKMVQCHACNRNNRKYIRIINSLSCVQLWTKLYFLYYFSLIYVYMFTNLVFIHILYKNHKKESQKTYNCIPYRLELTNWTPVKNKSV